MFLFLFSVHGFGQVLRQPYLQVVTPTSITVRWNTGDSIEGKVHYRLSSDTLTNTIIESEPVTFHEVTITGLTPDSRYYYSIDTIQGSAEQYFITSPLPGNKEQVRIWVISDFGQTSTSQNEVRMQTVDRWKTFNGNSYHANFVLSLGDQTENDTQEELQQTYFNHLDKVLLNSPLFTIEGNHDFYDNFTNYKKTFSIPSNGEAGGYPSQSPDYYSFDYANIHIVCLSTEINDINGPQLAWLRNDLKNIDKDTTDWLIACLHRPFHSGGYHPTDASSTAQKQRDYWLKELENYGVDLILQGHNAIYERSFLIDNLTGITTDLNDANIIDRGNGRTDGDGAYNKVIGLNPHNGTVFIEVAPGGDATNKNSNYQIFSYSYSGYDIEGSVVIDVDGANRMNVFFLCNTPYAKDNYLWDYFTINKSESTSSATPGAEHIPDNLQISAYPNPFEKYATISYHLSHPGNVIVGIYDMLGNCVSLTEEGFKESGIHNIDWTARDKSGQVLPPGIYIVRIQAGNIMRNAKMILSQ